MAPCFESETFARLAWLKKPWSKKWDMSVAKHYYANMEEHSDVTRVWDQNAIPKELLVDSLDFILELVTGDPEDDWTRCRILELEMPIYKMLCDPYKQSLLSDDPFVRRLQVITGAFETMSKYGRSFIDLRLQDLMRLSQWLEFIIKVRSPRENGESEINTALLATSAEKSSVQVFVLSWTLD